MQRPGLRDWRCARLAACVSACMCMGVCISVCACVCACVCMCACACLFMWGRTCLASMVGMHPRCGNAARKHALALYVMQTDTNWGTVACADRHKLGQTDTNWGTVACADRHKLGHRGMCRHAPALRHVPVPPLSCRSTAHTRPASCTLNAQAFTGMQTRKHASMPLGPAFL